MFNFFKRKKEDSGAFDWLVAGLGNPGRKYEMTRHNVGRMAAHKLAERFDLNFYPEMSLYLAARLKYKSSNALIILPDTFMNLSGEAVAKASKKYNIPAERVLICVDEYNFPVGKLHVKPTGGDGGHNGVASVIEMLNTTEFWRLRLGIGKDFPAGGMVDYVLSKFPKETYEDLEIMLNKSVDTILTMLDNNPATAMSLINSGKLWDVPKAEKTKPDTGNEPR